MSTTSVPPLFLLDSSPPPIDDDENDVGVITDDDDDEFDEFSMCDNITTTTSNAPPLPSSPITTPPDLHLNFTSSEKFNSNTNDEDHHHSLQDAKLNVNNNNNNNNNNNDDDFGTFVTATTTTTNNNHCDAFTSVGGDINSSNTTNSTEHSLSLCSEQSSAHDDEHIIASEEFRKNPEVSHERNSSSEMTSIPPQATLNQSAHPIRKDEMSPSADVKEKSESLSDSVKIEDLLNDSSDDECFSFGKNNAESSYYNENSDDFFAVHVLESRDGSSSTPDIKSSEEFNEECSKPTSESQVNLEIIAPQSINDSKIIDSTIDLKASFDSAEVSLSPIDSRSDKIESDNVEKETSTTCNDLQTDVAATLQLNEDEDDFDDFQDFESAPPLPASSSTSQHDTENETKLPQNSLEKKTIEETFPTSTEWSTTLESAGKETPNPQFEAVWSKADSFEASVEDEKSNKDDVNDDDDDDDEFGDFSVAPVKPESASSYQVSIPTSLPSLESPQNVTEKVKNVLTMMFNTNSNTFADSQTTEKNKVINSEDIKLKSIDVAKALNYQWLSSECRHSFIKALGVDSKNILFGDNWNSSMPRYAANLSLQPLKPTELSTTTSMASSATKSSEVPAVDFDWKSAGLVNPLDGSKQTTAEEQSNEVFHATNIKLNTDIDSEQSQQESIADISRNDKTPLEPTFDLVNAANASAATTNNASHQQHSSPTGNEQQLDSVSAPSTATGFVAAATETTLPSIVSANSYIDSNRCSPYQIEIVEPSSKENSTGDDFQLAVGDEQLQNTNQNFDLDDDLNASFDGFQRAEEKPTNAITSRDVQMKVNTMASEERTWRPNDAASIDLGFIDEQLEAAVVGALNMNANNVHDDDTEENHEAVATSTFAGPLKETHIFTPSKNNNNQGDDTFAGLSSVGAGSLVATTKSVTIDFDYEKAAAGIIIDETVVRKEYRDIEYDPGFSLENDNNKPNYDSIKENSIVGAVVSPRHIISNDNEPIRDPGAPINLNSTRAVEEDDDFSDFQSVPPPVASLGKRSPPSAASTHASPTNRSHAIHNAHEMILSPAVLLPQAIPVLQPQSVAPKIEWGDSVASIDPDELMRIEQLFSQRTQSQSKTSSNATAGSGSATPKNTKETTVKIEKAATLNDDDWNDFVSVPVPKTNAVNHGTASSLSTTKKASHSNKSSTNNDNDDEWSDFVSSSPVPTAAHPTAPTTGHHQTHHHIVRPETGAIQFNSASWHNGNFYSNPLSSYYQNQNNVSNSNMPTAQQQQQSKTSPQRLQNPVDGAKNFTNYNNNNNNFVQQPQQLSAQYLSSQRPHNQQQQQQRQQRIHIMQDFSTLPPNRPIVNERQLQQLQQQQQQFQRQQHNFSIVGGPPALSATPTSSSMQIGSAKVAPTISLIPDMGFVAPALPTHTTFINSLPKPNFGTKK